MTAPLDPEFPAPLSRAESIEFRRRRRGRNLAMLIALLALVALFYVITLVKMSHS